MRYWAKYAIVFKNWAVTLNITMRYVEIWRHATFKHAMKYEHCIVRNYLTVIFIVQYIV